jgi:hypothetical protein
MTFPFVQRTAGVAHRTPISVLAESNRSFRAGVPNSHALEKEL